MTSEAAGPVDPARKSLLWLVAVGFFMQTLDATIINTALPAMAASLGACSRWWLTRSPWRC